MDSRILRYAVLVVTLFVGSVFVLMLGINGYFTKNEIQPAVAQEAVAENEYVEEDGYVKGSDLSAWMNDDTFFDVEKSSTLQKIENEQKTLSLVVSSVEKDLRIHIVNGKGKPVTGYVFNVRVGEDGLYKDSDRDGEIYISDLKPGEYEVLLEAAEEFYVPEEAVVAKVKANIEYQAIADISYLIKTEDEIDAKKEDTAVKDAALDSEGGSAIKLTDDARFGIDVSKWNKEIDWEQIAKEGVDFAIIRAGYRGSVSGSLVVDPYFEKNIKGATDNGIDVGIYFFTQAVNEREAVEEASIVMSLVQGYDISYPIFIDTEGAGGRGRADSLEVAQRSGICQAFCETIRSGGYTAGIYASKNWLSNRLDITKFSGDNVIWLAEYKDKPTYGGTYGMWQYTSSGRINGIEGRVDFNLCYLDFGKKENREEEYIRKADVEEKR